MRQKLILEQLDVINIIAEKFSVDSKDISAKNNRPLLRVWIK